MFGTTKKGGIGSGTGSEVVMVGMLGGGVVRRAEIEPSETRGRRFGEWAAENSVEDSLKNSVELLEN